MVCTLATIETMLMLYHMEDGMLTFSIAQLEETVGGSFWFRDFDEMP